MKRIALLGFIVFVVPVWFVSCGRCGKGGTRDFIWTYRVYNSFFKSGKIEKYSENDTIYEDSIRFSLGLERMEIVSLMKNNFNDQYKVMACENEFPEQRNKIKSLVISWVYDGDVTNLDTSLMQSLKVCNYQWKNCSVNWHSYKTEFIKNSEGDYNTGGEILIKTPSIHKKNIQILAWAIKENGDTLKAISQKVFCK